MSGHRCREYWCWGDTVVGGAGVEGTCVRGYCVQAALINLFTREGGAGADGAILPYVGHLQLISTLKIGADCTISNGTNIS